MTDRFNPAPAFKGHYRALWNRKYEGEERSRSFDWWALVILFLPPVGLATACLIGGWKLDQVSPVLDGVALLTGGLLAAFAQIASWRDRLTARRTTHERSDAARRDAMDEAVSHILVAVYLCLFDLALLVAAVNVGSDQASRWTSGGIVFLSVYLAMVLLMVLPKLYSVYVVENDVDDDLSGLNN